MSDELAILVVCTGNVCRSPLAEQLLATRLEEAGIRATTFSAGTGALVGERMPDQAAALSTGYGGVPIAHRAQQLTPDMIVSADLVLTAERSHRATVVSETPRAARYTFTLQQFARIVAALDDEDLAEVETPRDLVAVAARNRGFAPPLDNPDDDDIIDPYRREQSVYDASGEAIDQAVATIVAGFVRARRG